MCGLPSSTVTTKAAAAAAAAAAALSADPVIPAVLDARRRHSIPREEVIT